jgi:hypothetical protein
MEAPWQECGEAKEKLPRVASSYKPCCWHTLNIHYPAHPPIIMTILHIVLPKIHPEADPAAVSEVSVHGAFATKCDNHGARQICNDILGLGQKCVKPTGERYIKSVSGGKDNSVESLGVRHIALGSEAERNPPPSA